MKFKYPVIGLILLMLNALHGNCSEPDPPVMQRAKTDSLIERLSAPLSDTARLELLTSLCFEFLRTDPEQSIRYGQQALRHAEEHRLEPEAHLYWYLANACNRTGDIESAIGYQQSVIGKIDPGDSVSYFKACDFLAHLYLMNDDYLHSVHQYEQNLQISKDRRMDFAVARSHAGLANAYRNIGDKEKEAFHLNEFLAYADSGLHKKDISLVEFRLGDYLLDDFQYEISLNHYKNALKTAGDLNDSSWMASILNRIAWNYFVLRQFDSSMHFYQGSLAFALPLGSKALVANAYGNMGTICRERMDYNSALDYYKRSLELSVEIGDYFNLAWVSNDISELYALNRNYEQAYQALKEHMMYEDSVREEQYQEKLLEARARYEAEKAKSDFQLVSLKLKNNRILTWGLAGAILAVVAIAALLIAQNRLKTRQRLESMNHTISEITQRNLRQQMNPHFIFNTLNSIQYYVFQNDKIASNHYLSKFAQLMRKTLINSQYTSIPIKEELEALELYLELESLRFKEKFDWTIRVDEEIDTLLYKIPTLLIQPYVENSICHGLMHKDNGKGNIRIDLLLESDHIRCMVDDNGIGREKALEIKNNKNREHHSLGTSITESRLKLISSVYGKRMNIHYTDKMDEEGQPAGTRVEISIPIIT